VLTVVLPVLLRSWRRPVIFAKYSGIGDIICTFPTALELKKRHPGGAFIYNCHAEFHCLPRLGGVTSHMTGFIHIGLVGHWYRFLLAGFYQFASDDDVPGTAHAEVMIRGFARRYGVTVTEDHPRLHLDPGVCARVRERLVSLGFSEGPVVAIHAGPTWPVKEWPRDSWGALVAGLRERGFTNLVQLGTARHLAVGAVAAVSLPGVASLVDQLTLEESVALISQSHLLVGVDSGLLHAAAALRVPAVGLWGATSPQFLFSANRARSFVTSKVECQGCHHRVPRLHWMTGCPYDIRCMKEIAVAEVLNTCLRQLPECKS
jgi:ADP-heptose:LPS heptosyltransferase